MQCKRGCGQSTKTSIYRRSYLLTSKKYLRLILSETPNEVPPVLTYPANAKGPFIMIV